MINISNPETISKEDIQSVYEIRHHPKYEPGFEEEVKTEKVDIEKGGVK
jgi:hypothetical protein